MANTAPDPHDASWYRDRIDYLAGFMLPQRFETLCRVAGERTRWMTVCTENTFHPQNASAIVRTCEANSPAGRALVTLQRPFPVI